MTSKIERVSFSMSAEMKAEVLKLKDAMNVSLNTIFRTAIAKYIEKQEIKRWERGADLASKDKNYLKFCKEWSESEYDNKR